MALERIQALLQWRPLEFAHDLFEGTPGVPVATPEIAVEHSLDTAQRNLGVPDGQQRSPLNHLALVQVQLLPGDPGQSHQGNRRGHRCGGIEELHRLVHLLGMADAVEITGRQCAQDRHGAPEAWRVGIFHCAIPSCFS